MNKKDLLLENIADTRNEIEHIRAEIDYLRELSNGIRGHISELESRKEELWARHRRYEEALKTEGDAGTQGTGGE